MPPVEAEARSVEVCARVRSRFSFALHQNGFPLLLALSVANDSDRPLDDLLLTLHTVPVVLPDRIWRLDHLDAGTALPITDLVTPVDAGLLAGLTEAQRVTVVLTLMHAGTELAHAQSEVELLPRNHWGGMEPLPEHLAAFVQPNDPAVDRILKQASDILGRHQLPSGIDGYTSGRRERVWEIAQAVWGAICAMGISYALPPASFETVGQKVRSPSQIWDGRVATCLDTSLLMASCLEQAGLHPVVVIMGGHAFVGCWLIPECFPYPAVDDVAAVRTRVRLDELVLIETTLVTERPSPTFTVAVGRAQTLIGQGSSQSFIAAIDVHRARMEHVVPLASLAASAVDGGIEESEPPAFESGPEWAQDLAEPAIPVLSGRLERWQGKLLDLTLRNRLLQYRPTKGSLALDAPDPAEMVRRLADGRELSLVPRPPRLVGPDVSGVLVTDETVHSYAMQALTHNEVPIALSDEELTERLLGLYRSARTSLEENGANTLYLAVGFLVWHRAPGHEQTARAPLILIPVRLTRTTVRSGFRLSQEADDPQLNRTLLEMLEREFRITLPEALGQDGGVDVLEVWRRVSERIKDLRGWEVVSDVVLSTFSFTKLVMWKDMVDRLEALQRNRVVRYLMDPDQGRYPQEQLFPDPRTLDARYRGDQTHCPLPADSSQLAAVMAVASGQDFRLIGPPGTGKSQTIANLICQCLADEKTVLFIAEKTTALEVVQNRLEGAGLGPFCLELHSNKTEKRALLDRLRRTLMAAGVTTSGAPAASLPDAPTVSANRWERAARKVQDLRDEIGGYEERLHARRANGLSIFSALVQMLESSNIPHLPMSWPSLDQHSPDDRTQLSEQAEQLEFLARASGLRPHDPLEPVRQTAWSPTWQTALLESAGRMATQRRQLEEAVSHFVEAADLPQPPLDPVGRRRLEHLADCCQKLQRHGWVFALRADAPEVCARLESGRAQMERRADLVRRLSLPYDLSKALVLDLQGLQHMLRQAERSGFLRQTLWSWRVRRTLARAAGNAHTGQPDAADDLKQLLAIEALDRTMADLGDLAQASNGLWRGWDTDLASVVEASNLTAEVRASVAELGGDRASLRPTSVGPKGFPELCARASALRSALVAWEGTCRRLRQCMAADEDLCPEDTPEAWEALGATMVDNAQRLQAWCAWQRERQAALTKGLGPIVQALEEGRQGPGSVRQLFAVNYCRWWTPATLGTDPILCGLPPAVLEAHIAEFAKADDEWREGIGPEVARQLAERLRTRLREASPRSEEAHAYRVLLREVAKKRRHLPVRRLFQEIGPLLPVLAPCLLMSPLSVAQYLAPDAPPFDLVVFDEASQIPSWDAVGAIARGRQLVVVGDPKQLPPTTFFGRTGDDDDLDPSLEADLESVLDDCEAIGLPELQLRWHYRSRSERLIAFSNAQYYDNQLVTFPSPTTRDQAVQYHWLAGAVYEKGGTRTNPAEARTVADFVLNRLRQAQAAHQQPSIGVVTFNAQQQKRIEDLLEEARAEDGSLEPFFTEDGSGGVFVKNLENVQGHERDVMCFSITYGPDEEGRISMNFGPLNKQGGERRLNVAITRARRELHVFASLRPEDIDTSRSRARGVSDLRRFLEYAQRGGDAHLQQGSGTESGRSSAFTAVVARALEEQGWKVQTDVGASQLRVDIGVVHPDDPGTFLAGILCDAPPSDAQATVRDRHLLRPSILEGLGWRVLHVRSLAWWMDAEGARSILSGVLTDLLAQDRGENVALRTAQDPTRPVAVSAGVSPWPVEIYRVAVVTSPAPDPERFFEHGYDFTLREIIRQVVAIEGPIQTVVLARRIARLHGFARTGGRIAERVRRLGIRACRHTKEAGEDVFWPNDVDPQVWDHFRAPGEEPRAMEDIPLVELRALARRCSTGTDLEADLRRMAEVAGLKRIRVASRERMEQAWRDAVASDRSPIEGSDATD